ncbi:MAG: rRNA maturation RNase YbeY [Desulfosarcinaceae bacterium]|nr:rRNA maturation RNase YbeY [Desulfosarcinaceae bacterium]
MKAAAILNALDCPDGELSIVLVDDDEIAALNQQYLQRSGPTNVIAFSMREGAFSEVTPHLIGDVVISLDTCRSESEGAAMPFEERLDDLLIHGILHLFGYDHVSNTADAAKMAAKSKELKAVLARIDPTAGEREA